MYATVTNYVRNLTDGQYGTLMEMFHWSKSLYNVGLYNARQEFFASGGLLRYEDNYAISYSNENYKMLAPKRHRSDVFVLRAEKKSRCWNV